MKQNKKSLKSKIVVTGAMVGAAMAVPALVDTVENIGGINFTNEAHAFTGGVGTIEDPYIVTTSDELMALSAATAEQSRFHYKLGNDIDLTGLNFKPMFPLGFQGTFNGAGHTIKNMNISDFSGSSYVGFISRSMSNDVSVKNIKFLNPTISPTLANTSTSNLGILMGVAGEGTEIENIQIENGYIGNSSNYSLSARRVGGLVGSIGLVDSTYNVDTSIEKVSVDVNMDLTGSVVGGLAGQISNVRMDEIGVSGSMNIEASDKGASATNTESNIGGVAGWQITASEKDGFSDIMVDMDMNINANPEITKILSIGGYIGRSEGALNSKRVVSYSKIDVKGPTEGAYNRHFDGLIGDYLYYDKDARNASRFSYYINGDDSLMGGAAYNSIEYAFTRFNTNNIYSANGGDNILKSNADLMKKSEYERYGFDFDAKWTMQEGLTTPRLKIQNVDKVLDPVDQNESVFEGGSGTVNDPFLISTVEQFKEIEKLPKSHFKLANDIDFEGIPFKTMVFDVNEIGFTGTIDGNGFKIKDLVINETHNLGNAGLGIFDYATGAVFKNIVFDNAVVDSGSTVYHDGVGVLAGTSRNVRFENIKFENNTRINSSGAGVGSLSGIVYSSVAKDIVVDGAVITGGNLTGGLFGEIDYRGSYSSFNSSPYLFGKTIIDGAFVKAKVTGKDFVGGLVGQVDGSYVDVKDVVVAGSVSGDNNVGGLTNAKNTASGDVDSFKNIILYNSVRGSGESKNVGGVFGIYQRATSSLIDLDGVFAYNSYVGGGEAETTNRSIGMIGKGYELNTYNKIYQYATIPGGAPIGVNSGIVVDSQVNSVPFYQARSTMDFGNEWVVAPNGHPALAINPVEADNTFTEEEEESSQFAGGKGTLDDPFLVSTPAQLKLVASNLTAHFKLINDIDLDYTIWTDIIGTNSTSLSFKGTFDGDGHTIKNYQLQPTDNYQGLFGYVYETGAIKNLNVDGVTINTAETYTGSLVGSLKGVMENVKVTNVTSNASKAYQGGVIGVLDGGKIDKLTATGIKLTTSTDRLDYIGGVVGSIKDNATSVSNVVVDADVSGGDRVGIFAGNIAGTGNYQDIITFGTALGVTSVGGYVGYNASASTHTNIFSYATKVGDASITKNNVGGLVGYLYKGKFNRAFANPLSVNSSVATYNGDAFGRVGTSSSISTLNIGAYNNVINGHSTRVNSVMTIADMKSVLKHKQMGADFTGNWRMIDGKTPFLMFNPLEVDLVGGDWTYSPINIDYIYVEDAQALVDAGVANLDVSKFEQAQPFLDKISDDNVQKQAMLKMIAETSTYITSKSLVDTLRTNPNYSLYKEIKESIELLTNQAWKANLTSLISSYDADMASYLIDAQALQAEVDALTFETIDSEAVSGLKARANMLVLTDYKPQILAKLAKFEKILIQEAQLEALVSDAEANASSVNARNLQNLAETNFNDFDISSNSYKKIEFYNRLQANFLMIELYEKNSGLYSEAEAALIKAEKDTTLENVESAETLINKLPDDSVKSGFVDRLNKLKEMLSLVVDLEAAIKQTISSMEQSDYNIADEKFKKLTKPDDISKYTPIMKNVLGLVDAATAVKKVEETLKEEDLKVAQALVDKIATTPESLTPKKIELQERLDVIAADIAAKAEYEKAEEAVKKAEETVTRPDAESAQDLVDKLPAGPEKDALQDRLDVIFKTIEDDESELASIEEATKAVEKAEASLDEVDIDAAQEKVTALPDSDIKNDLQNRLDKLKTDKEEADALAEATKAVEKAESTLTEVDFDDAQKKVTALKDSPDKNALQDRLDALKGKMDQADALAEATKAVEKAEGSKATVDIDAAQEKVTALVDSPEKQALQDRLDKLKAQIDADNALAEATKAVEKAEGSKALVDIDAAQEKVTALPDSAEKQALQERLDALKSELENAGDLEKATQAVEKAESTRTQEDVNTAQDLVTKLDDSPEKQALQDRLDALKAELEALDEATKAVEKAESTLTDVDFNDAQEKVTALKDSPEKQALQDRLDALKDKLDTEKALEDAKDAVDKAENSKDEADIKDAQDKIDALPDGKDKDDLQDRLDKVKDEINDSNALSEATKAVEKAEGSLAEVDINDAQEKVTALPDTPEKQALQDRLDALKDKLDAEKALEEATKAVEDAEKSKSESDIKDAQDKIDALPDGDEKDALQDRLDKVKDENEKDVLFQTLLNEVKVINKGILDDVIKPADFPTTREQLEAIRKQGEALTNVDQKAQLNSLIDATLALMDLIDKIEGGDKTADTIGQLPDSKVKDKYLGELAESDALAAAEAAVVKAEGSIALEDIEAAEDLVAKLAPSDKKEELKERLKVVREKYEELQLIKRATELVEQAESTKRITDIERAEDVVKQLKDGDVKTGLQDRLDALRKALDDAALEAATKAVEKAEELKTNVSIGYAKDKVNALRPSPEKDALLDRIAALEKAIYDQEQMDRLYKQALEAVIKAENSSIVVYLNTAIKLVAKVSDADERKQGLVDRIDVIKLRNQIAAIDAELGRLELRPSQSGVEKLQGLISKLPDVVTEKEAFQARLDAVKRTLDNENYAKALKGVEFAESTKIENKRAAYFSVLPLVDVLLESERKTALEERLAKVLAEVEAYEKLDGDYTPGDSVVKSAQSIKDEKVKPSLLAWAEAVEDAERYNSSIMFKELTKAQQAVPQEILDNEKYADLIEELTQRSAHVRESSKVFSNLVARGAIKKAYVAILTFENERTEVNKVAALKLIDSLKRFKGHEGQVEKLVERVERIEIVEE